MSLSRICITLLIAFCKQYLNGNDEKSVFKKQKSFISNIFFLLSYSATDRWLWLAFPTKQSLANSQSMLKPNNKLVATLFSTSFQQFLANYCRIWFRAICHTNKHYTFNYKHLISKQNLFLSFKENKLSNMKVFHRLVKSNFFIQKGYWVQKLNSL